MSSHVSKNKASELAQGNRVFVYTKCILALFSKEAEDAEKLESKVQWAMKRIDRLR